MSKKKENITDVLKLLEKSIREWSKQGRTEEELWAVKNYLTGAGRNEIKKLLEQEYDKGVWQHNDT